MSWSLGQVVAGGHEYDITRFWLADGQLCLQASRVALTDEPSGQIDSYRIVGPDSQVVAIADRHHRPEFHDQVRAGATIDITIRLELMIVGSR
jgi:hypothetical protein